MNDPTAKATPQTLRIIWLAFLVAPVIYCIVAWQVTSTNEAGSMPLAFTAIFSLTAVVTAVAGYVLPPIVARQQASVGGETDPPAIYQTSMIVRWACFEAVSIYGFILCVMSYRFLPVLVGAVIAVTLIAGSPPRPPLDDPTDWSS